MDDNLPTTFHDFTRIILAELDSALMGIDPREVNAFLDLLLEVKRLFVAGKGRTGLQMESFAMRLMHLGLAAHVVGDVTTPAIRPGDLLVLASASGETRTLVDYAMSAKKMGVRVAAITANRAGAIAQAANTLILVSAPTHKIDTQDAPASIQPMGGLFESSLGILLNVLILLLMRRTGVSEAVMIARHANLE